MFFNESILKRDLGLAPDDGSLQALEHTVSSFCATLPPTADQDEYAETIAYVTSLAKAKLVGLVVPSRYGGVFAEIRVTPLCLVRQWLARYSGALDSAFIMQGLGSYPVTLAGPERLRQNLLPRVARGEAICAFALTEPDAGSDVAAMTTTATPGPDGCVLLSGRKCFISNAGIAHSYVVFAREHEPTAAGKPRFGAFWVPGDAPGLSVTPTQVIAPHPIGTVHFDGVKIAPEHRIGEAGQGLRLAFSTLDVFRVTVGAAAAGLADRAMSEMVAHLQRRVQFGRPLASQQGLRFAAAEVATDHLAAQMLVYRAARARDEGRATPDITAMAKLTATETAQRVIDRAVQSLGGLGVTVGQTTERLYREIRALRIYEGTSEIQKLVIARALFGD